MKNEVCLRAVVYARYSSDRQSEDSIDAQVRACEKYAEANGIKIIDKYLDEAKSGKASKTQTRKNYNRLLRDVDAGKFDAILIHKYDRIARSLAEHVNLEGKLHNAGISLVAVEQDFGSSNEAKIMRGMMWILSEYYSDNLSNEVKKGHRENALKALHNGGRSAFGYRVENGKYVIHEIEAAFVREMFAAAKSGEGYNNVIKRMADAGITGRLGKPIGANQIHEILRNEKYTGIYTYMPEKPKNRRERREKLGAIRVEDAVPAIIDKRTFAEVQKIMDSRIHSGRHANYLCSGLVYCECGKRMYAHKSNKKHYEYYYYRCSAGCGAPTIKMEDVDTAAQLYLRDLLSDGNIANINTALRFYQSKANNTEAIFRETIEEKVKVKEAEYQTLLTNMTKASFAPEILDDMNKQLDAIKADIAALKEVEAPKDYTKDQISCWLAELKQAPSEKAVRLLIERIDVKKEGFNMTSTLKSLLSVGKLELVDGLEPPTC